MSKHQQYFQDMLESHQELFNAFKQIHDKYAADQETYQKEFNEKGEEVVTIIRRYENLLCSHSEGGKYGKFSSKLSEKFWQSVRAYFPMIDFVGVT